MMKDRSGQIRTSLQGQGGGEVVAARERGAGSGVARVRCVGVDAGALDERSLGAACA